jgi:hypothetical protein
MATMTEITTDQRVDDLRSEMHLGFTRTDQRIEDLRGEMRLGFEQVHQCFEQVDQRF